MAGEEGLKRRVLRDDVVEFIIEEILSGELQPGARVVETKISRDLQVSQGAVREALRDLKARGFVEAEPYKGSRVKALSMTEMQKYHDVRLELEPLAVRWAMEKETLNVQELRTIVDEMYEGVKVGNPFMIRKADVDFHRKLVSFAENDSLLSAWDGLANDYWICMCVNVEIKQASLLLELADKHRLIIDAIADGDIDLMKAHLSSHFFSTE